MTVRQIKRSSPEKAEQHRIRKLFESCGFKTYNLSQARASKQTPGLPDLWLVNPETGDALWWECKAAKPNGKPKPLRPEQSQFRDECLTCLVHHGWGTLTEAEAWLEAHGYGKAHPGGFVIGAARRKPKGGLTFGVHSLLPR